MTKSVKFIELETISGVARLLAYYIFPSTASFQALLSNYIKIWLTGLNNLQREVPPVPHRAPGRRGQRDGRPQRRRGRRGRARGGGGRARAQQQERQEDRRLPRVPGRMTG